jgi:uncharacterized protein (DUF885 family)
MKINKMKKMVPAFLILALSANCLTSFVTVRADVPPTPAATSAKSFRETRDFITEKILEMEPEEYRILGDLDSAGKIKDWRPEAIRTQVEFCREALKQLASAQTSSPAERLDKEVLAAHLKYLEYYYGNYHGELGNLQISVYPYDVMQYELQRFDSNKMPDAKTTRNHFDAIEGILRALPAHLKQQEENLLAGLKLRKPDKQILERLIERIGTADNPDSVRGGLTALAARLDSANIKTLLSTEQRESIRNLLGSATTAYGAHADFLRDKIKPNAKISWALGSEEYKRRFALVYGENISLDKLVEDAEARLDSLNAEMVTLARELKLGLSLNETLEKLRERRFNSEPELLEAYRQMQKKIDDSITSQIGLPVGAASYQPSPPGVPVSPATNWAAPLLSKGLGIVLVNTSKSGLEDNAVIDLPWITIHEGNPGHASQSLLFQNAFNEGSVSLCRFLNVPDEVGYVRGNWYAMANIEGWALFTERLLLDKPELLTREERLASLSGQALRAARVVVDIRMHTAGWSREEAVKYLKDKVGMSENDASSQVHRYSRIPLQAVSYYFGAQQFEELRKKYEKRFGDKFYRQLLSLGPVPPRFIDDYLKDSMPSNK